MLKDVQKEEKNGKLNITTKFNSKIIYKFYKMLTKTTKNHHYAVIKWHYNRKGETLWEQKFWLLMMTATFANF